jgi:hypothetical protein
MDQSGGDEGGRPEDPVGAEDVLPDGVEVRRPDPSAVLSHAATVREFARASIHVYITCDGSPGTWMPHVTVWREIEMSRSPAATWARTAL